MTIQIFKIVCIESLNKVEQVSKKVPTPRTLQLSLLYLHNKAENQKWVLDSSKANSCNVHYFGLPTSSIRTVLLILDLQLHSSYYMYRA
jgi:hypothetical protein